VYPESVSEPSGRNLPIYSACANGSLETVVFLYDLYPEALQIQIEKESNIMNRTVCSARDAEAKVDFLIQNCPESVEGRDRHLNTPLHCACDVSPPNISIIKKLFKAYPEAIHVRNAKGSLPLHSACQTHKWCGEHLKLVKFLVSNFPTV